MSVIVCGLGQVGYRVSILLLQMGEAVTVITTEARAEFEREIKELGATVIIADARDSASLTSAGIQRATALITVTDSDLTNIEISLDAQALNPDLRVIARLFDQTLARRLEESVGIHRALAMSILAAPSFAAAAVGSDVIGAFDYKGGNYSVHQDDAGFVEVQRSASPSSARVRRRKQHFRFANFVRDIPATLKYLVVGIFVLSVISVSIFCLAVKLSPVDSIYFVVTTLTTTGYGDITVKDASTWVKLYTCLMMIFRFGGGGDAVLDHYGLPRIDAVRRIPRSPTGHVDGARYRGWNRKRRIPYRRGAGQDGIFSGGDR